MVSNRRDLAVQLLGQLLYVERRLHDAVLPGLTAAVRDEELRGALQEHQQATRRNVERVEEAFRLVGVDPTSNRSAAFEGAVSQHEALSAKVADDVLADLFHAQAALHTEHWEMAEYRALLPLVGDDVRKLLKECYDEEGDAAKQLVKAIDRLADAR